MAWMFQSTSQLAEAPKDDKQINNSKQLPCNGFILLLCIKPNETFHFFSVKRYNQRWPS